MPYPVAAARNRNFGGSLLPFTDLFDRANGDLAGGWTYTAGKWTVASNAAAADPAVGASLWDAAAAAFTSGTYAWTAIGTNTIENDANTLKVTYGNNGSGAKEMLADAADLSANLTVGQWYQYSASAKASGGVALTVYDGAALSTQTANVATVDYATSYITFRAAHATAAYTQMSGMGATETINLDNLALKPITLADMFCSRDLGSPNVDISVPLTNTRGRQCGIVLCLDSAASPANFIIAYHDGINARMAKCQNGTYAGMISAAATYGAGNILRVRKSGNTVQLFYNGVQIGTDQDVTGDAYINNTRHGLFSTMTGNTFASFTAVAP